VGVFTARACERLRYYVYLYIDPRTDRPFYVGKGVGKRCFSHLKDLRESRKTSVLAELRKLSLKPRIEMLKYGLTEEQALLVEATAIDLLRLDTLTNQVRGFGARVGSRDSVESIAAILNSKPVKITDPVILINIHRLFKPNMDLHALYDATRSAWKVGTKRAEAKYALSVYGGIVREVFAVTAWVPGGTTMKSRDSDGRPHRRDGRWEFVGHVAEDRVRRRYVNRSVADYFKPGAQNPVMYVNC
jgi:uncharacterized protein